MPGASAAQPVSVTISSNENLDVMGRDSLNVDVGKDGQEEVRFKLKAKLIGNAMLTFKAGEC